MATIELLNAGAHRALAVRPPDLGDRHFVQIVAGEFAAAAARCPVILSKNPENGKFYAGAVLGFKTGENLLRDGLAWAAGFRPLDVIREGFFIVDDQIAIDVEHPRFGTGDPLFDDDGAPAERLREVQHALGAFKAGLSETDAFVETLVALGLVEPIDIALRFDDGERISLAGIYTVSLDGLRELGDADALMLFRKGWLQLAYTMIGSLKQIGVLAAHRNRALARAPGHG
ncbi:SapC family protein [Hephaestia mangrovi]|uniref:SapC family protein n=1 Tax=Hephaestia mangrovi TaxID=2873268 RepID=UPI001CA6A864|nr:SapC family protein [Hephaestia mangrovi]